MAFIDRIKGILNGILSSKDQRDALIVDFWDMILSEDYKRVQEPLRSILFELYHASSFYSPEPEIRAEDPLLFGDDRLEELVRNTLAAIERVPGTS